MQKSEVILFLANEGAVVLKRIIGEPLAEITMKLKSYFYAISDLPFAGFKLQFKKCSSTSTKLQR